MDGQYKNAFGERLKRIREGLGLSQGDLADALSVPQTTISRYETGKHEAKAELIARLAGRYDIDLHWLLTGQEPTTATDPTTPTTPEIADKLEKARVVLEAGDALYAPALSQHIETFHAAIAKQFTGALAITVSITCHECGAITDKVAGEVFEDPTGLTCVRCGTTLNVDVEALREDFAYLGLRTQIDDDSADSDQDAA